jgi:putative glycosyltransferase (TIGR04372 family)
MRKRKDLTARVTKRPTILVVGNREEQPPLIVDFLDRLVDAVDIVHLKAERAATALGPPRSRPAEPVSLRLRRRYPALTRFLVNHFGRGWSNVSGRLRTVKKEQSLGSETDDRVVDVLEHEPCLGVAAFRPEDPVYQSFAYTCAKARLSLLAVFTEDEDVFPSLASPDPCSFLAVPPGISKRQISKVGEASAVVIRMTEPALYPEELEAAFRNLILPNAPRLAKRRERDLTESRLALGAKLYERRIERDPGNSDAYWNAANVAYLQGNFTKSVELTRRAAEIMDKKAHDQSGENSRVRFLLSDWSGKIGHTALLDVMAKLRYLGYLSEERRVLYAHPDEVANTCYLGYWKDHFEVHEVDDESLKTIIGTTSNATDSVSLIKLKTGYEDLYTAWSLAEREWCTSGRGPLLRLREEDRARGRRCLEEMGVPEDAWFVSLHVREGGRASRALPNADIATYVPAVRAIIEAGGWVIRMGHAGMMPLPEMHGAIDYANSTFKTDWMDVFLWAECKFFIGTASGPLTVPSTFGRPVLYSNVPGIGIGPWLPKFLAVPKLYRDTSRGRLLSFREMLDHPMGWTVNLNVLGDDIQVIDNDPRVLEASVIEMLDKVSNDDEAWALSELQETFEALRRPYGRSGQMPIANAFLKQYGDLLSQ